MWPSGGLEQNNKTLKKKKIMLMNYIHDLNLECHSACKL